MWHLSVLFTFLRPVRVRMRARTSIPQTGFLLSLHIHITPEDRSLWGLKWP